MARLQFKLFGSAGRVAPDAPRPGAARGGFTLLEVLIVIALIGILTAALVVGGGRLLNTEPDTPTEIFWKAVSEARRYALLNRTDVHLAFDAEKRAFNARTIEGSQTFPVPGQGDLQIEFLSTQRTGGTVLIGGTLVETQPLRSITFFEDGTCTPFRAQLRSGSAVQVIAIDPWTCAPVLNQEPTS